MVRFTNLDQSRAPLDAPPQHRNQTQAPVGSDADDCNAHCSVAKLTIALATIGWADRAGSPAVGSETRVSKLGDEQVRRDARVENRIR